MFKSDATRTLIAQIKILFSELFPSASNSFAGVFLLICAGGCLITPQPLPPANLADSSWTVRQGQAVWTLPNSGHDIAGDCVVATGSGGKSFVQFSKSPFPLVIGQTEANRWQVEFPAENKRYGGPGSPPKRLIWLYLPRVVSGKPPPPHWTWKYSDANWRLENRATGEALEGFFAQ